MTTMTQKSLLLATMAASSLLLTACGSGSTVDNNDGAPEGLATSQALFRPLSGVLPLPTNLLFAAQPGQARDGTLNIPSSNPAAIAVSNLDGWSTVAPITFGFNRPIDPTSVVAGSSVRLFNICIAIATGAPTGPGPDLEVSPDDYEVVVAATSPNQLLIKPTKPLRPAIDLVPGTGTGSDCTAPPDRNGYIAVVTNALTDTSGEAFAGTTSYQTVQSSAPLYAQEAEDAAIANAEAQDTPTGDATAAFLRANGNPAFRLPAAFAAGLTTPTDARTMETVRRLTNGVEFFVGRLGGPSSSEIIVSTIFSTQSVGPQLSLLAADARAAAPRPSSAISNTGQRSPGQAAAFYAGTIDLPYYLSLPTDDRPNAPNEDPWCITAIANQGNGSFDCSIPPTLITAGMMPPLRPRVTATVTVPFLVSVPRVLMGQPIPDGTQMPVVIFQHGITGEKSNLAGIADAFAAAGLVAIAIDHPLHGDRRFAIGSADEINGLDYFNLTDLVVGRDNLRQSVIDVLNLALAVPSFSLQTAEGNTITLDGGTSYLGHSLGGIVGVPLLALAGGGEIGAATLAMPGGGLAKMLDASPGFGPVISNNLAAAGAPEGSANYETFLSFAQQAVDSADPINWAQAVAAVTAADPRRTVHLIEVVGNLDSGGSNLPDQTVPNDSDEANPPGVGETTVVESGPLGGTDPLIIRLGLGGMNTFVADPANPTTSTNGGAVQFTNGDHGSILDPRADCLTWFEMQTETANFLASRGGFLPIGDSNASGAGTSRCMQLAMQAQATQNP